MEHVRATARVQHPGPGVKTTEVKARMATYFWFVLLTDHQQRAAHRRYKYGQWLRSLQRKAIMA